MADNPFSGKVGDAVLKGNSWRWLSKAAEEFAEPSLIRTYETVAQRFKILMGGLTVEAFSYQSRLIGPKRNEELASKLKGAQPALWRRVCAARDALDCDLMTKLIFGQLLAFGDPHIAGADPVWIPVRAWFHLTVDEQTKDTVRGGGMAYRHVRIVGSSKRLTDDEVYEMVLARLKEASANRRSPPKRADLLPLVKEANGTDRQLRAAMKRIPDGLKRSPGQRD